MLAVHIDLWNVLPYIFKKHYSFCCSTYFSNHTNYFFYEIWYLIFGEFLFVDQSFSYGNEYPFEMGTFPKSFKFQRMKFNMRSKFVCLMPIKIITNPIFLVPQRDTISKLDAHVTCDCSSLNYNKKKKKY